MLRALQLELPFRRTKRSYMKFTGFFLVYLLLFLVLYKPFFISNLTTLQQITSALALVGFMAVLLPTNHAALTGLLRLQVKHWTLGKELCWILFHFTLIGLFNIWLFRVVFHLNQVSSFQVFLATCLVGILPCIIDIAIRFGQEREHPLVYVQSDGNYIHLFKAEGNELKRSLLRESISSFEKENQSDLIRVHRRYLINPSHVLEVEGNSNGGQITLINETTVPYSRGYFKNVKRLT